MKTNELLKTALANLPKSNGWKPEGGEEYWVITDDGYIIMLYWKNNNWDNKYMEHGNCFLTKADAKKASQVVCEVLKLIREELYN